MSGERLAGLLQSMRSDILNDETLTEKKRIPSTTSSATGSEGSVVINKVSTTEESNEPEQPLRIRTKNFNKEDEAEGDDDFNDYIIEPALPPPKDLHPGKLYALFEFNGDDPSHCELERDDAVVLLNDQDNYWWLVRKELDGKIGFAPAECLETYDERLARLNCWKNEELERNSKENLNYPAPTNKLKDNSVLNKSVTFSNEVTVAQATYKGESENSSIITKNEDYGESGLILDDSDEGDDELDEDFDHYDRNYSYEEKPYIPNDDDEIVSDTFPVTPLVLTKKGTSSKLNPATITYPDSDTEEETIPLTAPNAFFSVNNNSGSIGEYSPSSSEFDSPGNTPPLTQFKRKAPKDYDENEGLRTAANIPLSKGTRNIANSIKMLDDLINTELNLPSSQHIDDDDDDCDDTLTYDDNDTKRLSSPIVMDQTKKNLSNLTDSTYTNSNGSLNRLNGSITSVENENSIMEGEKDEICTTELKNLALPKTKIHPEIQEIFEAPLTKMDELTEKLKLLTQQFS